MSISYVIAASELVNKQIYCFLCHDIVTCAIPPKSFLLEKEIALRFTVSRQSEVFIKPTEACPVQALPPHGTFVRKISARRVAAGRFICEVAENSGCASCSPVNDACVVATIGAQLTSAIVNGHLS